MTRVCLFIPFLLLKTCETKFSVNMTGVDSYNIDLKEQKVSVTGNVKPDEVLDRISRTGKTTTFWPKDDKGEAVAA